MKNDTELLDLLEDVVVQGAMYAVNRAGVKGLNINKTEARNLVGKIGARIIFGKDIADKAILPKKTT